MSYPRFPDPVDLYDNDFKARFRFASLFNKDKLNKQRQPRSLPDSLQNYYSRHELLRLLVSSAPNYKDLENMIALGEESIWQELAVLLQRNDLLVQYIDEEYPILYNDIAAEKNKDGLQSMNKGNRH